MIEPSYEDIQLICEIKTKVSPDEFSTLIYMVCEWSSAVGYAKGMKLGIDLMKGKDEEK